MYISAKNLLIWTCRNKYSNFNFCPLGGKKSKEDVPSPPKVPKISGGSNPLVGPSGPRPELDSQVDLYGCSKYSVKMTTTEKELAEIELANPTGDQMYGNTDCGDFKRGVTKLDRFFPKNQHTQRKF